MPFTENEQRRWHAARAKGIHPEVYDDIDDAEEANDTDEHDQDDGSAFDPHGSGVCGHCGATFSAGAGVIAEDFEVCDTCN